jgi:hypothetical protein
MKERVTRNTRDTKDTSLSKPNLILILHAPKATSKTQLIKRAKGKKKKENAWISLEQKTVALKINEQQGGQQGQQGQNSRVGSHDVGVQADKIRKSARK